MSRRAELDRLVHQAVTARIVHEQCGILTVAGEVEGTLLPTESGKYKVTEDGGSVVFDLQAVAAINYNNSMTIIDIKGEVDMPDIKQIRPETRQIRPEEIMIEMEVRIRMTGSDKAWEEITPNFTYAAPADKLTSTYVNRVIEALYPNLAVAEIRHNLAGSLQGYYFEYRKLG